MRARYIVLTLLGALLVFAAPAFAQAPSLDAIWARATSTPITLDGVLDEPAWAQAESVVVWYGKDNGVPGSGYLEEGGRLAKDSTRAVLKFLRYGNQLYLGATVRDSSVGGSVTFNRLDGFLMAVKDHRDPNATISLPLEHFYSWWHPEDPNLNNAGSLPGFRGVFGATDTTVRTADRIAAWDAVTKVHGISNSDTVLNVSPAVATSDTGYTVEMRFDVTATGYDFTKTGGDEFEWNISIYDCDWFWPLNVYRFSANRTWWQGPWGNDYWYDEVRIYGRDDVTTSSGPVPAIQPELTVKNLGALPPPVIDGYLTEPVWAKADSFVIRYGDFTVRNNTYPGVMRWRSGQYQPVVLGSQAAVLDPGDATVRYFFKGDTLYFGFDVRDKVVQYYPLEDRWDGFRVSINDLGARYNDRNLASRPLTFIVGPDGKAKAVEYLPFFKDTVGGAQVALQLKPGTTVDTLGLDIDTGYTAELAVDLTKLGYPHGLGNGTVWFGVALYDGDSFTPFSFSYGTRAWFAREREYRCCPVDAYLNPNSYITLGVDGSTPVPLQFAVLGNYPNPFRQVTQMKYALPRASRVSLDVYDIQGRLVASRPLGLQSPGPQSTTFSRGSLASGLYLYRFHAVDPRTGDDVGSASGKLMILQ